MRIVLPLLCVLCAARVRGAFDGTCPRKEPPPGVLVVSQGSKLVLTCSGRVEVDGVKVSIHRNSANIRRGNSSNATPTTENITSKTGVWMKIKKHPVNEGKQTNSTLAGESRSLGLTGYTASTSTHTARPTSVDRQLKGEEMDGTGDYEEEEEEEDAEEGSRVTRGTKSRLQWKWTSRTVRKGVRDRGETTFERRGAALSLSPVRLEDSGRYTCYHRGRERSSFLIHVADPPETPSLSCYKSPTEAFLPSKCSYSHRSSRCWCALDHNEDEQRTLHMAYLCVTSIAGNATSALLHFLPLSILKPDPPSDVTVQQEEGQEMRMTVTWSLPNSWKSQESFYVLNYEIKYRPLKSSLYHGQIQAVKERSYTITDAMPGVEYSIQLRTKEEYDGQWSDWSTPVHASSWLRSTIYTDNEGGSGTDVDVFDAAYVFRHKERFMRVLIKCKDSPRPPPSSPTPPEGQALVAFAPPHCKKEPQSDMEKGEEEQRLKERVEAMNFNNTSYFFLHRTHGQAEKGIKVASVTDD
ncbi:Interleukin-6 receptor subunit alpha [Liparis tanakae]|uniref:Interleukin-6 receptor subunit alpha n=1 Tax=Liparis tanakae TaxID=230148 RepID=A0A4Z2IEI8_9TELE|nr:Interleukin-6 receptor subunit alpha [Liparis tanakae]